MHISLDISPIILILIVITAVLSLTYTLWEFFNYRSIKKSINRSSGRQRLGKNDNCNENLGVSVIIYSDNKVAKLKRNLPQFLSQEYPLYEIIVVNDGINEMIQDYIDRLSLEHDNIHYTYTPDDARNLSRKKLALMVGIKAAKYDIILTTNANCAPQSCLWISAMANNFAEGADVVIGHSKLEDGTDNKKGNLLRSFMSLRNATKYLVHAIRHKPYRGTSDNLAYRKSLFFKNKGFSRSMHLHYGEDDLFINEITTINNTCVELSPESIISVSHDYPAHIFKTTKLQHCFTEQKIHSGAFILSSISSTIYYAIYTGIVAIIILGYSNLAIVAIALIILLATIIPQMITYRKTAQSLQSVELLFTTPIFTLLHPIINLFYKLKSKRHTAYNYTWQRLKN